MAIWSGGTDIWPCVLAVHHDREWARAHHVGRRTCVFAARHALVRARCGYGDSLRGSPQPVIVYIFSFDSVMKHLAIPPKAPPTQSILAAPVRHEHDTGLYRRRWIYRIDLADRVVSCVAAIPGWVVAILYVRPCVLDGMVDACFVRHRRQVFGCGVECTVSAPELFSPHRIPREALVRQERHLVADRESATSPHDTDVRRNTLEQTHECNHVCLT